MITSKSNEFSFTNTMELLDKEYVLSQIDTFLKSQEFLIYDKFRYCISNKGEFYIGNIHDDVMSNIELKDLVLSGLVQFNNKLPNDKLLDNIYQSLIQDIKMRHINYDINTINNDEMSLIFSVLEYPIKFLSKSIIFDILDNFTRVGELIYKFKPSDIEHILNYKLVNHRQDCLFEYIKNKIPLDIKIKAINNILNNKISMSNKSEDDINKILCDLTSDNIKHLGKIYSL